MPDFFASFKEDTFDHIKTNFGLSFV